MADVDGVLFFSAFDSFASGVGLWKSDGTEAGPVRVRDLLPAGGDSSPFGADKRERHG